MDEAMRAELQKGLEDIIGKFNKDLNPLEKLGGKTYALCQDDECTVIFKTTSFSKRKLIMGIELHGNIIEANSNSSDLRLTKVKTYLQTFCEKYKNKGTLLNYEDYTIPNTDPFVYDFM